MSTVESPANELEKTDISVSPAINLNAVIDAKCIFVVFLKSGEQKYCMATDEDDVPFPLDNIAFAASLEEIGQIKEQMESLLTMKVTEQNDGQLAIV